MVPEITPSHAVWIAPCFRHAFLLYAASSAVFCALHVFPPTRLACSPSLSASGSLVFSHFLASSWSLKSRPPIQSGLRLAFGTLSCCMLRHLLLFVLCMFSPIPGWHLRPLFRSLEALLMQLFGVILASEITSCHAVWILPRFWLTFCFSATSSAAFGVLRVFPNTRLAFQPSLSASGRLVFRTFWASLCPVKSRPAMHSGSCHAFGARSPSLLLPLLFLALRVCSPTHCWHSNPPFPGSGSFAFRAFFASCWRFRLQV